MREVDVPSASARHRRPIILLLAWLLLLQAFLAGVVTARLATAGVLGEPICHSEGADPGSGGSAPETAAHACCVSCLSAVPALAPPAAPSFVVPTEAARTFAWWAFTLVAIRGAIRAGSARAPPGRA
jgi:Protein of unknown function (DUF2946)